MTVARRLDHVAIAVSDSRPVVDYFGRRLGLTVAHVDELDAPPVRLTYLDAGNAYIQLVEPLSPTSDLADWLREHGNGLHHLCFAVDDVIAAARGIADRDVGALPLGRGRGRTSAFVPGENPAGVRLECTEFREPEDAGQQAGR